MAILLRNRISVVWVVLILLTVVSLWVGTDHGVDDVQVAGVAVLVVAFTKVRFVGLYFMELRHAPVPLRLIFEAWCVAVCGVVLGMYLAL